MSSSYLLIPQFYWLHYIYCLDHRLIKITDSTLCVVFSRFMCVSCTITLRQKLKGDTRSRRRTVSLSVEIQDILNETHINLEKTTSSVLSVILINLWFRSCKCVDC